MIVVHPGKPGQAVGQHTHRRDRRISRMNVHKNARLTPQGRLLLVRRITEEGWRIADAAQAAGISERQSYRWAVAAAGLKHKRTRPYTPRTNGKAERFIQTSLREWGW